MNHNTHTAVVTGANSGFGFESAAQLADAGYARVILACRTLEKANAARKQLIARTNKDIFETVAIDVSDLTSTAHAAQELIERPHDIDLLLLNAGGSLPTRTQSADGIEMTLAVNLFGHHLLTMMLLEAEKLSAQAHIVIAGSESARADKPMFAMFEYGTALESTASDNIDAIMDAVARGEYPIAYDPLRCYVNAKIWSAWWTAVLARKLPEGMVAVAVSPGSKLDANSGKDAGPVRRYVKIPLLKLIGPQLGKVAPVSSGAKRYIDAGDFTPDASGKFFGSPAGKYVGPMEVQPHSHFYDERLQNAAWRSIVRLTGMDLTDGEVPEQDERIEAMLPLVASPIS